ncbi:hypothetical protein [Sphingopyxis sp.]|uniref:hypothetical protein n=1 Tax=Sphingopyxis sp. TaxID=1908224 RepID=UPI002FC6BEE8
MRRFYHCGCAAAMLAMLGACSFQTALDKMVEPERQREILSIAERICTDPPSVRAQLHPEIASTIDQAIPVLPRECPGDDAKWQLANYSWKTNVTPGLKERQEEVVVVGTGKGKWTTISLRFYARNEAPLQITEWNVVGSATRPAALEFIDQYETGMKTLAIAIPILLIAIGGLVFWLIRRQRAKRAA